MLTLALITTLLAAGTAASARGTRHSPGYLLAGKLNRALASTPMRGTGFALVVEGRRWHVHPAFIAGVAGPESTFGAAMCEPFNAWSLGSCGRAWHPPAFRSWRESIGYFARWFRSRWPSPSVELATVRRTYCPTCDSGWEGKVAAFMVGLGFQPTTRYP